MTDYDYYYDPEVVTDFTTLPFKPGDTARWLDGDDNRRQGVVVGAHQTPALVTRIYVLVVATRDNYKIEEVDEEALLYGWEPPQTPPQPPVNKDDIANHQAEDDVIPF